LHNFQTFVFGKAKIVCKIVIFYWYNTTYIYIYIYIVTLYSAECSAVTLFRHYRLFPLSKIDFIIIYNKHFVILIIISHDYYYGTIRK